MRTSSSRLGNRFAAVLLVALIIAWLMPAALVWGVEFDTGKLKKIRDTMQGFVDRGELAGAVTLVGTQDAIVHHEAVGFRDLENKLPMERDTVFRIASMTKPITALAIMQLVDAGKLAVTDPVEKHLPEFKGQMMVASREGGVVTLKKPARPITIRDLLTHTSGMPGGPPEGLSNLYSRRHLTLAEGVYVFSQRPLDFEPGSKWSYCNSGIDTLGRIVEVVSGESFSDYLRNHVFQPLDMPSTFFFRDHEEGIAMVYGPRDGKLQRAENLLIGSPRGAKYPIPAGGLFSRTKDLAALYQTLLRRGERTNGPRLVSAASFSDMTKLQTGELICGFTPGMGFGYGFAVVKEPQGVTERLSVGTFGHGGAFGTQGWIDPHKGVFFILLIQRTGLKNGDASDMRRDFQTAALDAMK